MWSINNKINKINKIYFKSKKKILPCQIKIFNRVKKFIYKNYAQKKIKMNNKKIMSKIKKLTKIKKIINQKMKLINQQINQ